ncbi:MAG TPA: 3'-5' exonuclease [Acidimicrobiales bacterium]|nr:3'-5' exonuclease [Acidimicrobiales bacterium]
MGRRTPVYGLDIETDTTVDGLDPAVARILTIALSSPEVDEIFTGDEASLLRELDARLAEIEPGVICTWNGGAFDLPFIADRAAAHGVPLGLRLELDPHIVVRGRALPGHRGAYRGAWHAHAHLDAYRVYRADVGPAIKISCGLKSIARFVGLVPVEVDRTRIHQLDQEALHAYASSDARLARVLAERRWPSARRSIDRTPETLSPPVDHRRRLAAMRAAELDRPRPPAPPVQVGHPLERRPVEPRPARRVPLADAG